MATVQMNVRIPLELKDEGDAVLKQLGISVTDAVRGLYEFLVRHQRDERAIRETLQPEYSPDEEVTERRRKLAALQETQQAVADFIKGCPQEAIDSVSNAPYDELRERAWAERLPR